ncbi:SPOR domain-containing protein [Pseudoxanthomonas daejeonensis]|uniref:Sporulation protein n=1 Tax=Pseudoxanthomonas daejeonensis TaxID=266062 RepID=A0ABQ6Z6D6_9GAMM|nr:SPOR domain-containing protein [Pseudoxanthomonas daejeonensis]KAF1693503.1 sporulation protein [Pseudoxanthomonas daejeonensis]UNK57954.1 SPOR domain-containing protein [Pseudoxanthomonas daejeonensis]
MDTTLKQRLIGGAVLVALAVIFLPMLVQGPAPDSGVANVSTRVPDAPGGEYETRELPLIGQDAATASGQPVLPAPAATPAAATEQGPAPSGATEAATPGARPDPAVAAGQWAVTFGAYASARDAEAVLSRLRQAGLAGFSEQATVNGRQAWRVRVGPYADRALAEAGRLQAVRIRSDVNAQVIALDAGGDTASPAPAVAAAAPATPGPTPQPAGSSQASAVAPAPAVRTEPLPPEPAASRPATPPVTPKPAASAQAQPATPKPAATAPAPSPAAPAAAEVGFAVQMGAFANAADANALRDRLRAAGFSAIVQPVRTDKGTLSRVRVGPVASRAEADQLKARLASGFGAGMVVPHP